MFGREATHTTTTIRPARLGGVLHALIDLLTLGLFLLSFTESNESADPMQLLFGVLGSLDPDEELRVGGDLSVVLH